MVKVYRQFDGIQSDSIQTNVINESTVETVIQSVNASGGGGGGGGKNESL